MLLSRVHLSSEWKFAPVFGNLKQVLFSFAAHYPLGELLVKLGTPFCAFLGREGAVH